MIKCYCVNCNTLLHEKAIYYGTKRCKSCAGKLHSKKMKGKYVGIKHHHFTGGLPHCKICDKELSNYQYKYCKSCCQLGDKNCMKNSETKLKAGISHRKYKPTQETKNKIGRAMSGSGNPMFGKVTHSKGDYYKGLWMRSSWEIKYAKYLDRKGIKWLYEPKAFDLGNSTYRPDFYLINSDVYIEIKGFWRDDAKKKFRLFKKLYPKIKIDVITNMRDVI